jgi:hypothetical protein
MKENRNGRIRPIFVQNSTFIMIDFLNFSFFQPFNRKIFFSRLRLTNRLGNQRINGLFNRSDYTYLILSAKKIS